MQVEYEFNKPKLNDKTRENRQNVIWQRKLKSNHLNTNNIIDPQH